MRRRSLVRGDSFQALGLEAGPPLAVRVRVPGRRASRVLTLPAGVSVREARRSVVRACGLSRQTRFELGPRDAAPFAASPSAPLAEIESVAHALQAEADVELELYELGPRPRSRDGHRRRSVPASGSAPRRQSRSPRETDADAGSAGALGETAAALVADYDIADDLDDTDGDAAEPPLPAVPSIALAKPSGGSSRVMVSPSLRRRRRGSESSAKGRSISPPRVDGHSARGVSALVSPRLTRVPSRSSSHTSAAGRRRAERD